MSRRRRSLKKNVSIDPRYNSPIIGLLINMIMKNGKKTLAQKIVYQAFQKLSEKLEKGDPLNILILALDNIRPKLEIKSRRVGGATYQVPIEVTYERQQSLAFRWLIKAALKRKGMSMNEALSSEIIDAYNNVGSVVKQKDDMHKMAQSNRAFAHLNW